MTINNDELLYVIREVAKDANVTATVKQPGTGALIAGTCAFVGGLIGGPRGLAIGGAMGAVVAAVQGAGTYKPLPYVMSEMTPQQRNLLASSMRRVISSLEAKDAAVLLAMITANSSLKSLILKELGKFLKNEMELELIM